MPQFATEHAHSRLHLQAIPALAAASARALVAIACLLLAAGSASAQEQVQLDTQFSRGKLTELSGMKTTLAIPAFADERDVADPRTLFVGEQAEGGIALADRPFAEIVGEAMRAGFAASNARLESEGAGMRLAGTVTATEMAIVDRGGVESLQLTLRTSIQLVEGTRIVWQTKLFGRGTVPKSEGIAAATTKAIDRLIEELLIDDYFLAEIR